MSYSEVCPTQGSNKSIIVFKVIHDFVNKFLRLIIVSLHKKSTSRNIPTRLHSEYMLCYKSLERYNNHVNTI